MQIDTAGTYTLKYTAEDACGNITEVTREVVAEAPPTYRTVLYTDGTLIINESSRDQTANEALHGAATNIYTPLDATHPYIFNTTNDHPWHTQEYDVFAVEIGSPIKPTNTAKWFEDLTRCARMDLTKLDTSESVSGYDMFHACAALTSLDLSMFNTSKMQSMIEMFANCPQLTSLDLSSFDTSVVTTMRYMFNGDSNLTTIDISGFDTSNVTDMENMFGYCSPLQTIYASNAFVTDQVTSSNFMFVGLSTALRGGAGTMWTRNRPQDKTYARIDNPPDAPGYFTLKSA